MSAKHYITIAICALVMVISGAIFGYYYKEYIAPESYVIGSNKDGLYEDLAFAEYYSDEDILFSQNINKSSFSVKNGIASYEFNFEHKEFDGIKNSYMLYVNDYMLNNINSEAGTISGTYVLNYYDVDKTVLCDSNITINFSFYSLASKLQVTLPEEDLGYLLKYFKTDNFIITLANNPFLMQDKEGEVDEKINEITQLTLKVEELSGTVINLNLSLANKEAELEALKSADEDKAEQIAELEAEINRLSATIADLEYLVEYYEELLEAYENIQKIKVSYKVNSSVYDVQLVNEGTKTVAPVDPDVEGYIFKGWSIDGLTIVYVSDLVISEDITFTAVLVKYNTVTYNVKGTVAKTEKVEIGNKASNIDTPVLSGWDFYGWSLTTSKDDVVDITNLEITEDITLNAIFTSSVVVNRYSDNYVEKITLNYGSTSNSYQKSSIALNSYINLSSLLNSGYEFEIDMLFAYNNVFGSESVDFVIDKQQINLDLQFDSFNGLIPFYLTTDNVLYINSKNGSDPFITFGEGQFTFTINDVKVFTY